MGKRSTEITMGEWLAELSKQSDRDTVILDLARQMQADAFQARDPRKMMTTIDAAKATATVENTIQRTLARMVEEGKLIVGYQFGRAKYYAVGGES